MTNFKLFQTERVCRTTISNLMKMAESSLKRVENTGKSKNCLLRAITPFPTVFQLNCTANIKNRGLFGKGLSIFLQEHGLLMYPTLVKLTQFQVLTPRKRHHLKTLSAKEKMLVTSIFSFAHNVSKTSLRKKLCF